MKHHAAHRLCTAIVTAIAAILLVASCTTTVTGTPSYAKGGIISSAPPSDLEIEGSAGGEIDQLVANSLDDIMSYWEDVFKKEFGKELKPLAGGVHSYNATSTGELPCIPEGQKDLALNNAYYCPSEDAIAYDRDFLAQLADTYGDFIVPLVLAHEFGHFIQYQTSPADGKSIALEGQADCYAGVFVKQAEKGTPHFKLSRNDLDTVLGGYLLFRDEPGGSADDPGSHGSGFDRVIAFQEGFNEGTGHCKDGFGPDREYTEIPYNDQEDQANQGNLEYKKVIPTIEEEMDIFGSSSVKQLGGEWTPITTEAMTGKSGECDGEKVNEQLFYCPADHTVYYSETSFAQQVYEKFGDYGVMQVIALGYADGILAESDSDATGAERFKQELCLTGVYAGAAFEATVTGVKTPGNVVLSAGDLDEAIALLIAIAEDGDFIDTHKVDAFDRIDSFREGFNYGRESFESADKCVG